MKQRSLWQVLATYGVASWAVYQVALGLRDGLDLPDRLPLYAFMLMVVGLPIVLATWLIERRLNLRPHADDRMHKHFTWRRTLVGGALAFLALAVITAVITVARNRETFFAQGVLDSDDPVLLSDFASKPDTALGPVVTEALRVDMMQSQALHLAQPTAITAGLRRMNRKGNEPLTPALAHELAEREGFKAIISGDVSKVAGARYLLTARVVTPGDSILVAFSETAKDSTEIIPAVNRLSKQMRQKVGESLKHIRRSIPLTQATTSSLPALRKYSEALRVKRETGDVLRMNALLEEAVQIDSTFAAAWRRLGDSRLDATSRKAALQRAYDVRDRLSDLERYQAIASYMSGVKKDPQAAMDAYRLALDVDSMDLVSLSNLAGLLRGEQRHADAETLLKRVVKSPSTSAEEWNALWMQQYRQGHVEDAKSTIATGLKALPRHSSRSRGCVRCWRASTRT